MLIALPLVSIGNGRPSERLHTDGPRIAQPHEHGTTGAVSEGAQCCRPIEWSCCTPPPARSRPAHSAAQFVSIVGQPHRRSPAAPLQQRPHPHPQQVRRVVGCCARRSPTLRPRLHLRTPAVCRPPPRRGPVVIAPQRIARAHRAAPFVHTQPTHCSPSPLALAHWTPRTTPLVEDDAALSHAQSALQWPAALSPSSDRLPQAPTGCVSSGMLTPPSPSMRSCASTMSPSSAALTPTATSGAIAAATAAALSHTPSPVSIITRASDGSTCSDTAECIGDDGTNSTMCAAVEAVPLPPPPRAATKRRVDALHIDPAEQEGSAKRTMLGVRPSTMMHARTLYHAASTAALVGEIAPVLPADPRCFAEPTAFAKKHVPTHSTPTMRAQPADANRLFCAPLQAHAFGASAAAASSFAHSTAALSFVVAASCSDLSPSSASAPNLHLGGVSLVPFNGGSTIFAPLAMPPARPAGAKRFKLQCPPTPMPAMCIVAGESSRDLFCNKLLRRRGVHLQPDGREPTTPLLDDDDDSSVDAEGEEGAEGVDVHASPSFTALRTYASSPFAHSNTRDGPFLFERDFQAHKTVGCGGFFEVFRAEAVTPRREQQQHAASAAQRRQQREFEQFSLDLDTRSARTAKADAPATAVAAAVGSSSVAIVPPAPAAAAAGGSTRSPRRRVYAIKKSLRPFRSEYDRACLLRETNILALISETVLAPPAELLALQARGAALSVPLTPHRNPHLIRWHQTWQESGYFFQQLEYATCTLAEFVYVLMETPPAMPPLPLPPLPHADGDADAGTDADADAHGSDELMCPAEAPASFFHQHLPRLFLSIVCQLALALHTLHTVAGGGIVHLDLKPDNLLVNRRGSRLLLSDFGFSKQLSELRTDGGRGSPHSAGPRAALDQLEGDSVYMAIELLGNRDDDNDSSDEEEDGAEPKPRANNNNSSGGGGVATTACDMFSCGLLLFELVTNSELPKSGYLWQRLRQGFVHEYLPVFPPEEEEDDHEEEQQAASGAQGEQQPTQSRTATAVPSQSHLGANVRSGEAQQGGITAWMVRLIGNLMAPNPAARMSAADLLVAVEEKLLALGWIDPPPRCDATAAAAASVESRASVLAFEWTAALPPCLALPPLSSLNFNALLERAREMNLPPATPTTASPAAAAHSPAPHFTFAEAAATAAASSSSRGPSPQPCLMRQRSSPSPSRSGGFFGHKLQPRVSPVPFAHTSAGGLPQSPWSLDSSRASVTPLRMQRRLPAHARSSSTGHFLLSGDPAGLPRAPTPTHALMAANCLTPSLRRPRSSVPMPRSPSSANDATPAPRVRSTQPLPSVCRPSEQPWDASPPKPRAAASGSFTKNTAAPIPRPIIIPPQQGSFPVRRATFQPLSPFRLNSPARKHTTEGAASTPSAPAPAAARIVIQPKVGGPAHPPPAVLSPPDLPRMSAAVAVAERDAALPVHPVPLAAGSVMTVQMSLLTSSVTSMASSGALLQKASPAGPGSSSSSSSHYRALFTSSTQSIVAPSPALRAFSSGIFSALSSASAVASPPVSPLFSLGAVGATGAASAVAVTTSSSSSSSSRGGSMFGDGVARASGGVSMFGGGGIMGGMGGRTRSPLAIRTAVAPLPLLHRLDDHAHFSALLPSPVDMPGPALAGAEAPLWPMGAFAPSSS